jgi:uncharacterized membrane protein
LASEMQFNNPTHTFAPRFIKARQSLPIMKRSWRHAQFYSATAPSPYLNTARCAARIEIAPDAQVQKVCKLETKVSK